MIWESALGIQCRSLRVRWFMSLNTFCLKYKSTPEVQPNAECFVQPRHGLGNGWMFKGWGLGLELHCIWVRWCRSRRIRSDQWRYGGIRLAISIIHKVLLPREYILNCQDLIELQMCWIILESRMYRYSISELWRRLLKCFCKMHLCHWCSASRRDHICNPTRKRLEIKR